MKTYLQVTTRYLKVQKKRTVLTIVGIILSVALITGVGTILESIRGKMVRDAVKESGSYHIMFQNVDAGKVDKLRRHTGVQASGLTQNEGYTVIGKVKNPNAGDNSNSGSGKNAPESYNQYLDIKSYSTGAMSLLPVNISEGRLPRAEGEIAIDSWVLPRLPGKPSVGDKVKLDTGVLKTADGQIAEDNKFNPGEEVYEKSGRKEYTIVGILKPAFYYTGMNMASGITYLDDNLVKGSKYNVLVTITNFKSAISEAKRMVRDAGLEQEAQKSGMIETNEKVLRLYGESVNKTLGDTFMVLVIFVIVIVVVCMIAVIYNAFNISVLERVSQFGLLRCVGASSGQIRKIVLREAMLLSGIGIPVGVLCGTLAMKVLFEVIGDISPKLPFNDLTVVLSPQIIAASVLLGLFAVLISAYGPARHAARIAPMDALKNTGSYKKESFRKVKKSRLARLFFGVEGWIAWKNLRRNRKRFVITVFSMVVSIVLYIVFNSIFSFAYKTEIVSDKQPSDFMVYTSNRSEFTKQNYDNVKAVKGVGKVIRFSRTDINVLVPSDRLSKRYKELTGSTVQKAADGKSIIDSSSIECYGDEMLVKLKDGLSSGKIDAGELNSKNGVIILNTTMLTDNSSGKSVFTPISNYKPGDELEIQVAGKNTSSANGNTAESKNNEKYLKVKVAAVLETSAVGSEYSNGRGISLITTEKMFKKLTGSDKITSLFVSLADKANREYVSKSFEKMAESDPDFQYVDYSEMAKNQDDAMMILSIFIYGFITVITLIGSINIINTISTNLILRTRELSMMKAVGMTKGAIKKMVCLESIFHGIIAAFFGGIAGTLLSYLFYTYVANVREFVWTVPWNSIIEAGLGAVLIALLAGYLPLRRINKGVIIDNIRAEE